MTYDEDQLSSLNLLGGKPTRVEKLLLNPLCILTICSAFLLASSITDFTVEYVNASPTPTDIQDEFTAGSKGQAKQSNTPAANAGIVSKNIPTGSGGPPAGGDPDTRWKTDPDTGLAYRIDGSSVRVQSAGDGFSYPWGVWAAYGRSSQRNDLPTTAFDADTNAVFFGADFSPFDDMIAGVAIGYSDTNTETAFNRGEVDTDGFTIAPYLGFLMDVDGIPLDLSADAAVGFSNLAIDQFRTAAGARITSDTDQDIVFFATNFHATKDFGDVLLGARAGLFFGSSTTDGFTESNGTVIAEDQVTQGNIQLEGNFSYYWGNFEPFASVIYEIDVSKEDVTVFPAPQPANDTNDILIGLGVNWYSDSGWTAGFGWEKSLDRDEFEYDSFSIRIRADF